MRMSRLHAPTLKEAPREAELPSHALLTRAGFIRKVAAGIYEFLPLAVRSIRKISDIVREEMDRAGAQEVLMPVVVPAELWQESRRWGQYGPELLRFKDRKDGDFLLGPTHEEVIVDLVRRDVRSYRDLPLNLYQIQTKFRDEIRPRGGLMRGREFIMKDAYSFDVDEAAARRSYAAMYEAYNRIFTRCGFEFRVVDADPGNIGGSLSQEFQVLADTGEDAIVACRACDYAANVEKAEAVAPPASPSEGSPPLEKVATPGKRTIEEVAAFLGVEPSRLIKTLVYVADGRPAVVLLRGDHEANEVKIRNALGATELHLADEATIEGVTGAPVGFAGPVGLGDDVPVLADRALAGMRDAVTGANERDAHWVHVDLDRDARVDRYDDLRLVEPGDPCPRCGGQLEFYRSIEVGHIFYLGTKYSEPMRCTFLDEQGVERPAVMGCYGIGITRVLAAAVEQCHDEAGIAWPLPIAPFEVTVVALNANDEHVCAVAERLYAELRHAGVDVVIDDRRERPGVKLKDADLIGFPYQVIAGRRAVAQGQVEVKRRRDGERVAVPIDEAAAWVRAALERERERYVPETTKD